MKYKVGDKVIESNYNRGVIKEIERQSDDCFILGIDWGDGNIVWAAPTWVEPNYRAMYEQEKEIIEQIKAAFSRYVKTEGCSCCQDTIGHKEAEKRLAELLNPEPYEDGSGWKWY